MCLCTSSVAKSVPLSSDMKLTQAEEGIVMYKQKLQFCEVASRVVLTILPKP